MTFQIFMRALVLITCLIEMVRRKDKRIAWAVAVIGWFIALVDVL
jgi:hypothetical protein